MVLTSWIGKILMILIIILQCNNIAILQIIWTYKNIIIMVSLVAHLIFFLEVIFNIFLGVDIICKLWDLYSMTGGVEGEVSILWGAQCLSGWSPRFSCLFIWNIIWNIYSKHWRGITMILLYTIVLFILKCCLLFSFTIYISLSI